MANGLISCGDFTNIIMRRTEHLDEEILKDITPVGSINGMVEVGQFKPFDGTSHTYDRFNRVAVDFSKAWTNVDDSCCVGTPCDPTETKICFGSTRDEYHLETKSYATDLFCYDQMLTMDRAKEHYANAVEQLRDAQQLIIGNRIRTEMFRIAGYSWLAGGGNASGLTPFTYTDTNNLTDVVISALPTSKLTVNMLKRRLMTQILNGATGKMAQGQPPELEVLTDMETIWDLIQGDSNAKDSWRFDSFASGSVEYNKYGWAGRVGNFNLKADLHPIRFQILANGHLQQVFPYYNTAASGDDTNGWCAGIKGIVNPAYIDAPIQASFIWHRRAMKQLVLDSAQVHPMMPFVPRSFGGKWQFVMDNLTCGTYTMDDGTVVPIAVDNSRRNKGKFIADFKFSTKKQYPEFAEVFLHLRESACVVEVPVCNDAPTYVTQNYSSACESCDDLNVSQT